MKKKWLVSIGMVVALITGLLTPSVALAAKTEAFGASGYAYISGPYESWQTGPVQHAVNEPVDGVVTFSDWDAISGSSFETLHAGIIVLNPDGTFNGSLHGTFTIITADGLGSIEGNMRGKVSGTWNPVDPTGTSIDDYGTLTSTKGTGTLSGVKVRGSWKVHLDWDPDEGTYVGWIVIEGIHN